MAQGPAAIKATNATTVPASSAAAARSKVACPAPVTLAASHMGSEPRITKPRPQARAGSPVKVTVDMKGTP